MSDNEEKIDEWIGNKDTKGDKVAPMPEYSKEEKLTEAEENQKSN